MKKLIALAISLNMFSLAFAETSISPQVTSVINTTTLPSQAQQETTTLSDTQARTLVQVTYSPILLRSRLKKMYSAYQVTINNQYPGTLKIQSANINNGVPGGEGAQMAHVSKGYMWWGILCGAAGIIVIGLPILKIVSKINKKTVAESTQFSNLIPFNKLDKGETITFKVLIPLGESPQISLALKDIQSGLAFTKNAR